MAKCIFTFEDNDDGGLKGNVELEGFLGAVESGKDNTLVHDIYFLINNFINESVGIKLPQPENDYRTHHGDWVSACEMARDNAEAESDASYWQHQIDTLAKLDAKYA